MFIVKTSFCFWRNVLHCQVKASHQRWVWTTYGNSNHTDISPENFHNICPLIVTSALHKRRIKA